MIPSRRKHHPTSPPSPPQISSHPWACDSHHFTVRRRLSTDMGSLLIPLLGSVAAKAGDALVGELLRAWGLDKSHRKLERHLAAVQHILLDADVKSRTNPAVRRWMTDLKTAAYRADDVLDDFRYEALRRTAAQIRPYYTARKMLSYFTTTSPVIFRLSMSRKMKDALEMIDELVVEMNNFHFLQHADAPTIDQLQTHSHVNESEVIGRQDEKEQVVKILLDHSKNSNDDNSNVMVLPIVGMGGIGKTTLAQLVHNDQRVKHHFELVLWVCVSDKFVVEEIVRSVIEVATMKKCDLTQMEALQKKLGEVLGKKRYLLVLDDIWNEDRHKWNDMRSLLCSQACSGSAITVTSRSDQVASIMGTHPSHQISLLNDDQSWEIFHKNAFGREVKKQEEFISMAKSIVLKCKGLPLAIKTIATLLRSKNHSQWISIVDSDVWKSDILASGIVPALQLSYDHLSSEERICFSFCAIFPKDSLMDKDMLIQLWMANDFIASEARGREIFDVLVWRCFLQYVEIQNTQSFNYGIIHRSITCRMHDLMHDLAHSASGKDCSIMQEYSSSQEILKGSTNSSSLQQEVRHLSLDYVCNYTMAAMKEILAPRPRTILVLRWTAIHLSMAKSNFMSLRALKTLSIKTHMKNLKHLRYLDLSNSDISELPEATTKLYSLQALRLTGCKKLNKLPEGMRYMSSLRHIFLLGCDRLKHMPHGIGQLNSLQTLTNYVIDSDIGRGIDQLKDLNLGGGLSLTELRKVYTTENAKQGNISAKHNLKLLSLDWSGPYNTSDGDEVDTNAEGILDALRPHKNLEALRLCDYTGAKFSSWMHDSTLLEHLSELYLRRCKNCKDLPPLWQLPSLRYLSLEDLNNLTSICVSNDDTDNVESCISPAPFFPKLETMIVTGMPKLERWHREVAGEVADVLFPRLNKLDISWCPMLASMPKMLPLLEDLLMKEARDIPIYHLLNLAVQSNLECKCVISVEPIVGWRPIDIHLSRLGHSSVRLNLNGLMDNAELFEEDLDRAPCRFIKYLEIIDCGCLFPSQVQSNIWNHFGFVEGMWISGIKTVELGNLNRLGDLHLSGCSKLTGSFPSTISDGENLLLPLLDRLVITNCENLVEVPELPVSLEKLFISICPKLVSMVTIRNANKLKALSVIDCDALKTFAAGIYRVSALRILEIQRCPRIETVPEGLLQQFPTLDMLWIRDCPNLEEAFSRGGAYWNWVEAIPNRYVGAQDQSMDPCTKCFPCQ
ncbi:putative disease resistance protein RGA3 [Triticum urartu]|uniref:putative disease resistance protein RGA3 n=1 Tax=Triticum urartu TaxID=4572 RepID=UPI002042C52C|nr:putative disease resistance protein RGA3 [Triticum urartu]XP_048546183.1 putative disease resistance protein RGA3 [Triticum urartu]